MVTREGKEVRLGVLDAICVLGYGVLWSLLIAVTQGQRFDAPDPDADY